jgi:cholesterol oxidase
MSERYDVVIIGSGFGGSVAAHRLSEKGYRVCVLESGRRWRTEDFPRTNWNAWKSLWFPRLGMKGIQRISLLRDVMVLPGAGVGGGSLVYANTHYEPLAPFYVDPQWGSITDWEAELAPWYKVAGRMLGVVTNPMDTPADAVMRRLADEMGVSGTFTPTPVAVFFGEPGEEVDDPFFGGAGPRRAGCVGCGNCMVGCRFNAKNTLDKNYLWFAERNGATVNAERQVIDLKRSETGWTVTAKKPGFGSRRYGYTARHVIFSAGALGTTRLLLSLADNGRLPGLSKRIGFQTRTNSEAIVGAISRDRSVDYSTGIAITSSIHPNASTHIEPVRYGKGSNALGLLGTILVDGSEGVSRQLQFVRQAIRHPITFLRSLSVWHWSERGIILLVMQSKDNSLRLLRKRGLFGTRLTSEQGSGEPNPTYIPEANRAARIAASEIQGFASGAVNEALFDTPTTAHIMGGAAIGEDAEHGVIDAYHRVFGIEGLHVIDGAAIGANLGVNPSLTITAMSERAISMWPRNGEKDARPLLGEPYERLQAR